MHRTLLAVPVSGVLAAFAGSAAAGPLFLEGTGLTFEVRTDLPGGDAYPFAGLPSDTDLPMCFNFVFDSDTAASSNDGTTAVYEFSGAWSTFEIGGNSVEATSLRLTVFSSISSSWASFRFRNDPLMFSASVFFSVGGLQPLDIPTSLDGYVSDGQIGANSDLNEFLIPLIQGGITSAAITPAPGSVLVLGLAGLAAARRRR